MALAPWHFLRSVHSTRRDRAIGRSDADTRDHQHLRHDIFSNRPRARHRRTAGNPVPRDLPQHYRRPFRIRNGRHFAFHWRILRAVRRIGRPSRRPRGVIAVCIIEAVVYRLYLRLLASRERKVPFQDHVAVFGYFAISAEIVYVHWTMPALALQLVLTAASLAMLFVIGRRSVGEMISAGRSDRARTTSMRIQSTTSLADKFDWLVRPSG